MMIAMKNPKLAVLTLGLLFVSTVGRAEVATVGEGQGTVHIPVSGGFQQQRAAILAYLGSIPASQYAPIRVYKMIDGRNTLVNKVSFSPAGAGAPALMAAAYRGVADPNVVLIVVAALEPSVARELARNVTLLNDDLSSWFQYGDLVARAAAHFTVKSQDPRAGQSNVQVAYRAGTLAVTGYDSADHNNPNGSSCKSSHDFMRCSATRPATLPFATASPQSIEDAVRAYRGAGCPVVIDCTEIPSDVESAQ